MDHRCLAIGILLASPLAAQTSPPSAAHVVTGLVFDSVAGVPLAGAVVQIVLPDSTHRSFSGTTDATGHYRITGLPSGTFAIGFQHSALDALGLESPLSAFELGASTSLTVDLAIPSGVVVRAQRCGKTVRDVNAGMLAGFVTDPVRGTGAGAAVTVRWLEIVSTGGKFSMVPRTVTAKVSDDGTYLACGVPGDSWLSVRVAVTGEHVIDGHTSVPLGGATRLDFQLVDSGVVRGTAAIAGHVLTLDRTPLASGRAIIAALAVEVPIQDGEFSMTGLPAGTWDVEARALGFEPHSVLVQLIEHAIDSTLITITQKVQTLETVSIIGKPGRDAKTLDAIVARSRVADGTMFLPGNEWLKSADLAANVLGAAKGFRVKDATSIYTRGCGDYSKATNGDVTESRMTNNGARVLAVYLDGARVPTGLPGLNNMITMSQVLAIEAYPDVISAPFLWRTRDACAVVAVWTKH
jgi:Carboxypeptidase regulatory-like domain